MSRPILCIEDEEGLREDLMLELVDAGFTVDCVDNGTAGLAALQARDYALVLCDVQVPGLSGLQLLEALQGLPSAAHRPPFYMLTAYADSALHSRCITLGASRVLVKPIDYSELVALVASELGA